MSAGLLRHDGGARDAFVVLTERRALYLGIVPDFGMRGLFELFCEEKGGASGSGGGSTGRFECSRETIKANAGALRRMYTRDGAGGATGARRSGLSLPSHLKLAAAAVAACLFAVAFVVSVIEQADLLLFAALALVAGNLMRPNGHPRLTYGPVLTISLYSSTPLLLAKAFLPSAYTTGAGLHIAVFLARFFLFLKKDTFGNILIILSLQ